MSNNLEQSKPTTHPTPDDHPGKDVVDIVVNGKAVPIHRGDRTGLEIRQAAGCPSQYALQLLPDLNEVSTAERIVIKGGEQFVCHARMGQAS